MHFPISLRFAAAAAVAVAALGAASSAQARSDVHFSISLHAPGGYRQPAPVYLQSPPVYLPPRVVYGHPQPVIVVPAPVYYRQPRHHHQWRRADWGHRHGWQRRGHYRHGD